ncbi:hypothetical protein DNTS_001373 [Danionella cerebrum]|uniref:Coiled-coil domain-containing protein 62 n=1 Tax=Danionella cerebrum TaxID=2873325 RepID=A0A553NKV3_9TELE|nr:hypothetical protein DNTS_001373 [Danionella translucida]
MESFTNERRRCNVSDRINSSTGRSHDPWHSTPVKKNLFGPRETPEFSRLRSEMKSRPGAMSLHDLSKPALTSTTISQASCSTLELSTVQRQRAELHLLMAELRDRDQELNSMAASHQKQMLSWEHDRQRVLILEQRSARLDDELEKRTAVIRALSKRVKLVEQREREAIKELNSAHQHLQELSQKQLNNSRHEQELEERNQNLNTTVTRLSSQVGQLQVREEELTSMLQLKDKDMTEATNHILELSGRLCDLEKSLEEMRTRESQALRESEENKHGFRESRYLISQLRAELQEKTLENNSQREEIIALKQEKQLLQKEITSIELQMMSTMPALLQALLEGSEIVFVSGFRGKAPFVCPDESKSWREELLELSHSKQNRAESELNCLRQVCENQQNDLQLLRLNLESAREALRHQEGERSRQRVDSGLGGSGEREYTDDPLSLEIESGLISRASNTSCLGPLSTHQSETHSDCHPHEEIKTLPEVPKAQCMGRSSGEDSALSDSRADLDVLAVIDYDRTTGTPVCVLDLDFSPRFTRSATAHSHHQHTEHLIPSQGSRRSSICSSNNTLKIEVHSNQDSSSSSTSRLQRLLQESQEMVASLESSSRKSLSKCLSPAEPVCEESTCSEACDQNLLPPPCDQSQQSPVRL